MLLGAPGGQLLTATKSRPSPRAGAGLLAQSPLQGHGTILGEALGVRHATVMKDHHEWDHQGEVTRPSTTVQASLGTSPWHPSPIPDTNPGGKQDLPLAAPNPHLLGGGSAQDGTEGTDSERREGADHQGQQDHEQDIGVSQGIPAGICQHRGDGQGGKVERAEGTSARKVLRALKRRWHLNWR